MAGKPPDYTNITDLSHPRVWLNEIVIGNRNDFLADPMSVRKAINAMITAYQFIDRVYHYGGKHAPSLLRGHSDYNAFRNSILKSCITFEILHDAADTLKHTVLTSRPGTLGGATATCVVLSTPAALEVANTSRTVIDHP